MTTGQWRSDGAQRLAGGMREEDDMQLQEIEACIKTVKLDANKIKEHLAAENATTRVDRTKRCTEVEHNIREEGAGGGETRNRERDREESGRAEGEKMPPPMALRMPLCSVSHARWLGRQAEQSGHVRGHTPSV